MYPRPSTRTLPVRHNLGWAVCQQSKAAFLARCIALLGPAMGLLAETASAESDTPIELGAVGWSRDFDAAVEASKIKNRPLLVLFQEVPGCGTCTKYGQEVLSHPLIVEAAETLFVPVAVYNNIEGADKKVLDSFKEPAWNNPVVRIISPDRAKLTSRLADDYSVAGLASAMVRGLKKAHHPIPPYLNLLAEESRARSAGLERATFAMHCFWEGEAALGAMPGVVETRPGFVDRLEVVEVLYSPKLVAYEELLVRARKAKCASRVFARSDQQYVAAAQIVGSDIERNNDPITVDKEPKYYLAQTLLKHVPMTELQAARINAALPTKADTAPFLSPRQLALLAIIEAHPQAGWAEVVGTQDLIPAWQAAREKAGELTSKK